MLAGNPEEGHGARGDKQLVGRFGSLLLLVDDPPNDDGLSIVEGISKAFRADTRVASFEEGLLWKSQVTHQYYSDEGDTAEQDPGAVTWATPTPTLILESPFVVRISVPTKNQPKWQGEESPAEKFLLIWDGRVGMVFWTHPSSEFIPQAGGHIAINVLRDAVAAAGQRLFVQSCRLGCFYGFSHTAIRTHVHPDGEKMVLTACTQDRLEVEVCIPGGGSNEEIASALYRHLHELMIVFVGVKNDVRRVSAVETAARVIADRTQREQKDQRERRVPYWKVRSAVSGKWRGRHWRRGLRDGIEDLRMALSEIESARLEWEDDRFEFERRVKAEEAEDLFASDHENDVFSMKHLQVAAIEGFVEHASSRLESSALVRATVLGGAAGVVGGVLGAILIK